jgi:methionyl-tRNA formyltransferase
MTERQTETFPSHPKIVYMGTPEYAVPSLERLVEHGYAVQAVVTQPDRPKGRGRKPVPPPVKSAAQQLNLPVFQPEKALEREFCEAIRDLAPDLLVVVAFGQVLKRILLEIPRWGALNIHASLLPRYRGAAPIQWAVINDERETGLTAMRMDEGLDTGPILLQEAVPIGPEETAGELHDRLSRLSADVLLETLAGLRDHRLVETPQDHGLATYAPKIERGMSRITWGRPARSLSALIRGLDPWPGAVTLAGGKEIKLFSAAIAERDRADMEGKGIPGRVAGITPDGLLVETGEGMVRIREVQAPGRRRLPASEFVRGFPLSEGTVLGSG